MIRVFNRYVSTKSLLLVGLESLVIILSLLVVARLRLWNEPFEFLLYVRSAGFLLQVLTVLFVLGACCYYNELYDLNVVRLRSDHLVRLSQALGAGYVLLCLISYVLPGLMVGHVALLVTLILAATTIIVLRLGLDLIWALAKPEKNVLILGDGETALTIARELNRRKDLNLRLIGLVTPARRSQGDFFGVPVLGAKDELAPLVNVHRVSRIVVALDDLRGVLPIGDLVRLRIQGVEVENADSALAALTGRVWLRAARPSWFVFSKGFQRSRSTLFLKRAIDLLFGIVGLIVSSPALLFIALVIWLESRGPVLYRQTRVGKGGKVFELLKFRSMQVDAEVLSGAQWAQKNDPRMTRVGRFLRKYRLDEVPQFFNVIRGEMSFVGPRPERPVFVEQLRNQIPFFDERHSVRPGVTGWAQVQYFYAASVEDALRKLEYDLFYLKSLSIPFDILILFRTIRVVLFGHGR